MYQRFTYEEKSKKNSLSEETIDVLVANVIPTTKYFETRFDFMQHQINDTNNNIKKLREEMGMRFEQVDKRFEQIDKRFEQIDKRFEDVFMDIKGLRDNAMLIDSYGVDLKEHPYIYDIGKKLKEFFLFDWSRGG